MRRFRGIDLALAIALVFFLGVSLVLGFLRPPQPLGEGLILAVDVTLIVGLAIRWWQRAAPVPLWFVGALMAALFAAILGGWCIGTAPAGVVDPKHYCWSERPFVMFGALGSVFGGLAVVWHGWFQDARLHRP
ncbi:MAG: hypothetical protein ACT4PT_00125 [Methanobacteriota archaeon]